MKTGRSDVGVGLLVMAGFMLYGFLLSCLRDFAPDKEAWVASHSVGERFEARLAHVHGNLFVLLGLVLLHVGGVTLQQVRAGGVLRRMLPFLGGGSPLRERGAR